MKRREGRITEVWAELRNRYSVVWHFKASDSWKDLPPLWMPGRQRDSI